MTIYAGHEPPPRSDVIAAAPVDVIVGVDEDPEEVGALGYGFRPLRLAPSGDKTVARGVDEVPLAGVFLNLTGEGLKGAGRGKREVSTGGGCRGF